MYQVLKKIAIEVLFNGFTIINVEIRQPLRLIPDVPPAKLVAVEKLGGQRTSFLTSPNWRFVFYIGKGPGVGEVSGRPTPFVSLVIVFLIAR